MRAKAVYATQGVPLRVQLQGLLDEAPETEAQGMVHAVIVPDSNWLGGGGVSAEVFKTLGDQHYRNVIFVTPSHSGEFKRINVCSLDDYRTPLGEVKVSMRVRDELCDEDDDIFVGDEGHYHTAGVDVQLPFLQMVLDDFDVVPMVMGEETPDMCRELGHAIGEVMYDQPTLVVACADIVAGDSEAVRDFADRLKALDIRGLTRLMNSDSIEVHGKGAVLVALLAAQHRRACEVTLLRATEPGDGQPGLIGAILTT
jgi:MEMO1 family protein